MTPELYTLVATLVLALVQVFLPATGRTAQYGLKWNAGARDEAQPQPNKLVGRLERAQANLFETLPIFIGAVLIAHVAGEEGALTFWGTQLYFWGRVAYVPLYAGGIPYIRSAIWIASLAGLVMVLASLIV